MIDRERVERLQMDACVAKDRLIDIMWKFEEAGAIRKAKSLETIIIRLEEWQNK